MGSDSAVISAWFIDFVAGSLTRIIRAAAARRPGALNFFSTAAAHPVFGWIQRLRGLAHHKDKIHKI